MRFRSKYFYFFIKPEYPISKTSEAPGIEHGADVFQVNNRI